MYHVTCFRLIFLTELSDGFSTVQGVNGLIVVIQKDRVKACEIVVDVLGHLLVLVIKMERFTLKQAVPFHCEGTLYAVNGYPIGDIIHSEGMSHYFIGQRLLFVQ